MGEGGVDLLMTNDYFLFWGVFLKRRGCGPSTGSGRREMVLG